MAVFGQYLLPPLLLAGLQLRVAGCHTMWYTLNDKDAIGEDLQERLV